MNGNVPRTDGLVHIDPHIMCNPTIGDIDGDGSDDLIVPVSYLFDRAFYEDEENKQFLPDGLDLSMYIASGVVAFDLVRRTVKWSQHLDLTTDHVDYRCVNAIVILRGFFLCLMGFFGAIGGTVCV
jgi:hypothetical protein